MERRHEHNHAAARWRLMYLGAAALLLLGPTARADLVRLKTGVVLQGEVDRDNSLVVISDNLRRVTMRDTKVLAIDPIASERLEAFRIADQPLEKHGGEAPTIAVNIKAGEWDARGRRSFQYDVPIGPNRLRTVPMTQVIMELGPKSVRIRGVEEIWSGRLATKMVPREVALGIVRSHLERNKTNQSERLKIGRFMIQAEWYPEALAELDAIARDFPALASTVESVRLSVKDIQARRELNEIDTRRRAGQPAEVAARLKAFPTEDAPADVLIAVRDQLRQDEAAAANDKALGDDLLKLSESLSTEPGTGLHDATLALLRELAEAPDALRERLEPFQASSPEAPAEKRLALAVTGWLAGRDAATDSLETAVAWWRARQALQDYLAARDAVARQNAQNALQALESPRAEPADSLVAVLARLAPGMPPPLRAAVDEAPNQPRRLRALDDSNPEPTEYVVILPPEYNPARRYPVLIALHGGNGPDAAARWWAAEAARRGYVLIAPEYNVRGKPRGYRYSPSEHAAVEIALRDARKRFAIDSNRVFLAGVLDGGNMAWDFGLAHPDLFAGVVVISGLPGKYVLPYKDNAQLVPLYIVLGDLAPTKAEDFEVPRFVRDLITRNFDVTLVEYSRRGLEELPEEIVPAFDWMGPRRRDPYPKEFEAVTAREGDHRFFGVVVREFAKGRAVPPEQVHPLGKNLRPATIALKHRELANIYDVTTTGLVGVDLWFGPQYLDLSRKFEVRINGRAAFKGLVKPEIGPFLEDLRVRADRQQLYWLRYAAGPATSRAR